MLKYPASRLVSHERQARADQWRPSRRGAMTSLAALSMVGMRGIGWAQESSSKIGRIIVPFAPGAAVDVVARILAPALAERWGKSVIVENRPGGRTLIAADAVGRSEPDGDTLLFCLDDTFTIVPHLSKPDAFDPMKGLVPINMIGTIPMAFVVNLKLPVDSLASLIAYAHAHPTALSYGSSGAGSLPNLAMEMLKAQAKINMLHVPYRGLAPVQTAVIAGEVQTAILGFGSSRGMIEAGKLRLIAIASPERIAAVPNVPTTGEGGYPRVDATSRLTLVGPKEMSAEAIARVNDAVSHVLTSPEVRKQIESRDIVVTNMGPKRLAEEINKLSRYNAEAIKIAGVQPE
jgi:tripartite-type tricarboxylate transporter receptor subunit TctC